MYVSAGTGMRGSVHILVPGLIAKKGFDWIDAQARKMLCQARGSTGEHSEVVDRIDISNWRRIGLPEYALVEDMIKCANFLAVLEDKVIAGEDVADGDGGGDADDVKANAGEDVAVAELEDKDDE